MVGPSNPPHRWGRYRLHEPVRALWLLVPLLAACAGGGPAGPRPPAVTDTGGLGAGADLQGRRPFPDTDAWNRDVYRDPRIPRRPTLVAACGTVNLHPDFGAFYGQDAPAGMQDALDKRKSKCTASA